MDSRNIFESNKTFINKVQWDKTGIDPKSEYFTYDLNNEKSMLDLNKVIEQFFISDVIHVSTVRKESFSTQKTELLEKIINLFGKEDFSIWNENFKKVIEFRKMGVYRKGIIK
jgi:hypothetical protein